MADEINKCARCGKHGATRAHRNNGCQRWDEQRRCFIDDRPFSNR